MKRIVLALIVLVASAAPGAATTKMPSTSSLTSLASNPLVSSLMSSGLNANQATGGAGSLLGLAQEKLTKTDWSKIAKVIPGTSSLISQAKTLGGIKKFGSLASLAPAFGKMGLSTDQVKSVQGQVSDTISKGGGADLAKKFDGAMK